LLGILTGEADESNVGLHTDSSASMRDSHEMDVRLDDSTVIGTSEIDLDEGLAMEDISLGHEDSGDFELSGDEELSIVETNGISDEDEGGEISLDLGDVSLEENEPEGIFLPEEVMGEGGEQEINLDELSVVDSDITEEIADEETSIVPDSLDLEIDKETGGEERSEIELNLDDLKINETGELEIGKHLAKPDKAAEEDSLDLGDFSLDDSGTVAEEDSLDLGDLSLDDSGTVAEEDSLDLGDLSLDDSGPVAEEDSLDLGDLSLDDSGPVAEEDSLDLGDMPLDESDSDDNEETKVYDKPLSIDQSGLEAMIDESQSDISLDLSEEQGSVDTSDNEMSLDLENLDLDLDLDEPEDKS
jgi:hypothetical protein